MLVSVKLICIKGTKHTHTYTHTHTHTHTSQLVVWRKWQWICSPVRLVGINKVCYNQTASCMKPAAASSPDHRLDQFCWAGLTPSEHSAAVFINNEHVLIIKVFLFSVTELVPLLVSPGFHVSGLIHRGWITWSPSLRTISGAINFYYVSMLQHFLF